MKIATLGALLAGDIENAVIAETPGGIEAQEARGQRDFVASETLPIECIGCTREQLEQIGIVFGESVDDLFVAVQLPENWSKVRTSHSMWSDLVDDKGRKRAGIFYKAAFYDRKAHVSLERRFSYHTEPVCGYEDPSYRDSEWRAIVRDSGEIVWQAEELLEVEPGMDYDDDKKRKVWLAWSDRKDKLGELAKDWLDGQYPDWQNRLAYWE